MRRFLFALVLMIFSAGSALAASSLVKDVNIKVSLMRDGSAAITEVWQVEQHEGTEWYLVRSNLGDIQIKDLAVIDETGTPYINEGRWDVDRSLRQKAGRCGIVSKRDGAEICWGLGSYGKHTYTVSYVMTNVVKTLDDYDMLHMQFVSPGLSSPPRHVSVTIDAPVALSEENARMWGFGFYGNIDFSDGKVVAESIEEFSSRSSVIELLRFDKGIFDSPSVENRPFQEVLDQALDGSDFSKGYDEDDEDWRVVLAMFLAIFGSLFGFVKMSVNANRKAVLGVKKLKDIPWSRETPFGGNIMEAYWVMYRLGLVSLVKNNTFATAMVMKMIKNGQLITRKDGKDKIEILFNDSANIDSLTTVERQLYDMMKAASGEDVILQDKEFSRYAKRHEKAVGAWVSKAVDGAWGELAADHYASRVNALNPEGQAEARKVVGFKKFLSDFTLSKERTAQEVGLWQDYLIYASLFGIADKVAKELKDINPQAFEEVVGMDPYTYVRVMNMSSNLANSITNAQAAAAAAAARAQSGYGGHTSFGGGGGFHGGGFGGGAR